MRKGEKFISKVMEPLIVTNQKRGLIELGYVKAPANPNSIHLTQEKNVLHVIARTLSKHIRSREIIKRHERLIHKTVVGIFIIQDGKFKFVNPKFARLFKYKEDELIGMNYSDLISGCECFQKFAKNNKLNNSHCKSKGRRKDESVIDIELYNQRIDYEGKEAILGTVQDITRLVQAQERQQHFNQELKDKIAEKTRDIQKANRRLQSLNELKDEFIAVTSHELRSPLTAIRGYLSFLVEDEIFDQIPKQARDYLMRVYDNTDVLNHLVNNILDVSRIETNRFELYRASTDIAEMIEKVIQNLSFHAMQKKLSIDFNNKLLKPTLLNLDVVRMQQVLRNVIENAIKYTPESRHIQVDIEAKGIGVQISVKDEGLGIPKSEIFDIFDKFKQGKKSQEFCKGGAGLGLFITKKIVELHGGMIWVESELKKGTIFRIQLPLN